jgi:hypothetical protein
MYINMKLTLLPILIKLIFIDSNSGEQLGGVRVETDNKIYYSDLNGVILIDRKETIKSVKYVSYQKIGGIKLTNDTTINLKSID